MLWSMLFSRGRNELANALENDLMDGSMYWNSGLLINKDIQRNFTALGSILYLGKSVCSSASIYSFRQSQFHALASYKEQSVAAARFVEYCDHVHYSKEMNPSGGRKGYLRLRLSFGPNESNVVDFVNVHCVADTSNLEALDDSPFRRSRLKSLQYTCDKTEVTADKAPVAFIFGDVNMRLDLQRLVAEFGGHVEKKVFRNEKVHQMAYNQTDLPLLEYDDELSVLNGSLENPVTEYPVTFRPTYCIKENTEWKYSEKRCPAYCDRILVNQAAHDQLRDVVYCSLAHVQQYATQAICDHSPIYLNAMLVFPPSVSDGASKDSSSDDHSAIPRYSPPHVTFDSFFAVAAIAIASVLAYKYYILKQE